MRSRRIVLPIANGTHWSDVKAMVFEGANETKALPAPRMRKPKPTAPVRPANVMPGGLWFAPAATTAIVEAPAKPTKPKTDPRLIAASRELRDRWLEQVNATPTATAGKYAVSRRIEGDVVGGDVVEGEVVETPKLLAA